MVAGSAQSLQPLIQTERQGDDVTYKSQTVLPAAIANSFRMRYTKIGIACDYPSSLRLRLLRAVRVANC